MNIAADDDPRRSFADWLITAENPSFKRNIANRVWSWLMGRGIIHEPDDIRPDNPPSNPALLACLETELVNAKWDLRQLYRLILNSRAYQQSSIPRSDSPEAEALFASYLVRPLEAEVLLDALCGIGGRGEGYTSLIPEPFTFIPENQRAITLADGSITSPFLEMFGRPARDTGLESERNRQPTDAQRIHMLNSSSILQDIRGSERLRRLIGGAKGDRRATVHAIYMNILSRHPSPAEVDAAIEYAQSSGLPPRQDAEDLVWALLNSKEFLYRH